MNRRDSRVLNLVIMKPLKDCFKPAGHSNFVSFALLLLRLVAGAAFILHGWGKIQNPFHWMGADAAVPGFFQGLAALAEFGGGIAWVIGLLTPLASLGILCTMSVAIYMTAVVMHSPFSGGPGSWELAAVYFCVALLLLAAGPGRFSLDRLLRGERR